MACPILESLSAGPWTARIEYRDGDVQETTFASRADAMAHARHVLAQFPPRARWPQVWLESAVNPAWIWRIRRRAEAS